MVFYLMVRGFLHFTISFILISYSYADDIFYKDGVLYPAGVASLPIHTGRAIDLTNLKGPLEYINLEIVGWTYPFNWHGFDSAGKRVAIMPEEQFVFLNNISEGLDVGGWEVINEKGDKIRIKRPPHIRSSDDVFYLAICDIKDLTEETVLNRLGRPQQVINHDGYKAFLYTREASKYEPRSGTVKSSTYGSLDGVNFDAKTTHSISYIEKNSYVPYKFLILFNEDSTVNRVEDFCTGGSGL